MILAKPCMRTNFGLTILKYFRPTTSGLTIKNIPSSNYLDRLIERTLCMYKTCIRFVKMCNIPCEN